MLSKHAQIALAFLSSNSNSAIHVQHLSFHEFLLNYFGFDLKQTLKSDESSLAI